VIFAEEGNMHSAEEHLRSALAINPDDPIARELMTELLRSKEKLGRKD
jgi:hypothetical protein